MNTVNARHVAASALTQEVYEAHFRLVVFVLRKLHVAEQDIEEMTQETFLRFFNHCLDIEPHGRKSWLVTTARNVALDSYNKAKRRKTEVCSKITAEGTFNLWNGDAANEAERSAASEAAMATLAAVATPKRFHIMKDFYLERRSIKEIAEKRGLRVSSVTSSLSRQRAQFVTLMRESTL